MHKIKRLNPEALILTSFPFNIMGIWTCDWKTSPKYQHYTPERDIRQRGSKEQTNTDMS